MHLKGNKRKFNGHWYTAVASKPNKTSAREYAKKLREQGHNARIIKSNTSEYGLEYYIYKK